MNNINYLKKYIEDKLSEKEGGRWEYIIHPEIRDVINSLDEKESAQFSRDIFDWDERIIFHLADEIIFGDNEYLEQGYLYCLIFIKVTNNDNASYLSENLFACYNQINHETKKLDFYLELKQQLKIIWKLNDDNNYFIEALDKIINKKSK